VYVRVGCVPPKLVRSVQRGRVPKRQRHGASARGLSIMPPEPTQVRMSLWTRLQLKPAVTRI